jgi:methyl-accepting chemotaxis protein
MNKLMTVLTVALIISMGTATWCIYSTAKQQLETVQKLAEVATELTVVLHTTELEVQNLHGNIEKASEAVVKLSASIESTAEAIDTVAEKIESDPAGVVKLIKTLTD